MVMSAQQPPPQQPQPAPQPPLTQCRRNPLVCLHAIGIEAAFLAAAYVLLLMVTGKAVPGPFAVLKFGVLYVLVNLAARMMSDSLGDKMAITATAALGSKMASIMAPGIVSW
jgi:hypothetical protein